MLLRPGPVVIEKLLSSSGPEPRTKMLLFLGTDSKATSGNSSTFKKHLRKWQDGGVVNCYSQMLQEK